MKKILLVAFAIVSLNAARGQCPPNASAFESPYSLCPQGCGVLLKGWPEGVIVNIFGGTPLKIITSALIPGTYPGPNVGDAFVCVPCDIPLVFASAVPGATNGCVIITGGIIPVKLQSFSASSAANIATINWSTASESGTEKFVVERSTDGILFTEIATFKSTGNGSSETKYSYTDKNVTFSKLYYRLKTVELSGKIIYSDIAVVNNNNDFSVSIYPNPATNVFKISIPTKHLPAIINVSNAQGQIVYSKKTTESTVTISEKIPSGVYSVRVEGSNNTVLTQKIIKQ